MKAKTIKKSLALIIFIALHTIILQGQDLESVQKYEQKIAELQQKLQKCHQKKLSLLEQCDKYGCLNRISTLQKCINTCENSSEPSNAKREETRREIAILQRTIAAHNRKLLDSVPEEKKAQLRRLLHEHSKLWQELCQLDQNNQRQCDAFELFFI